VRGTTVYLPCLAGPVAVEASAPNGFRVLWQASVGGGPPILAGGLVWTMSQDGYLFGLNAATGRVTVQASVGLQSNHFPTPGIGEGLLLAPTSTRIVAFAATPAGAATTTTGPGTTTSTSTPALTTTTSTASASGGSGWATAGIIVGGAAVVAALLWFLRVRRRRS